LSNLSARSKKEFAPNYDGNRNVFGLHKEEFASFAVAYKFYVERTDFAEGSKILLDTDLKIILLEL